MAEMFLKMLKPTLLEYLDKAKLAAPAAIAALIAKLQAWLPIQIDRMSVGLKDVATRELPGVGTALTIGSAQAVDWLKLKAAKL